ncbi:hypothetical protein CLOSYM_04632 [[Clostridium] symbiosum ATCC 14940]|uniref:Uncharacterized protein n=2 Tax=Clostridium symbiosum TaxID=1512 RepID=A0ABC9TR45_CLOSY|nr:hypothetical protein CLOSYM_04632 [[Clostridium] symbiosum ATCC 14940]
MSVPVRKRGYIMKQQIILLYAGQYQIVEEKTGEIKSGVTMNYYFNVDLVAEDNTNGSKGTRPAKSSADYDLMNKVVKAPGLYDAEFSMNIGSDGKPVLKICDLDFISEIVMQPVTLPAASDKKAC